ncbi:unnamed protein product [Rhodiola kirilowii]
MERYFSKRPKVSIGSSSSVVQPQTSNADILTTNVELEANLNDEEVEIIETDIVADPGLRKPIESYESNIRDRIRREYVAKGPCQPKGHNFPRKKYGKDNRAFRDAWFEEFEWLEYSVQNDAAFCFWCFLFKTKLYNPGDEAFTSNGFSNWKKGKEKFREHVGSVGSPHNKARIEFENFKNQRQSVSYVIQRANLRREEDYRIRVTATLDVIRFILCQGLPMRGHDETSTSINRGIFLELLTWYGLRNKEIGSVILKNAPGNSQMIAPAVQKDMVHACAFETTRAILADLSDGLFSILVDESRDCSLKEQMAVLIRYVNKNGEVVERILGLVHVRETSAICLKEGIDSLFAKYGLSLSRVRGQGYDGASNMRGEFNGLKALILKENPSAWYVHCFAHQLQLVIVAVCKVNRYICDFFNYLGIIVNICGSSCKRADNMRQLEHARKVVELEKGVISSGSGKNQETSLKRPGDTRWGSHYITIIRLKDMWSSVVEVLHNVFEDGSERESSAQARGVLRQMQSYEFIFPMFLMKRLLGITNALSMALQERDQNMLNAINQIRTVKDELQKYRDSGWDGLVQEVEIFCQANKIPVINMDDIVPRMVRVKRDGLSITNHHHYKCEIFYEVLDLILREFEHRFSETSTYLLDCFASLDPKNGFSNFDVEKLARLPQFYPNDFSNMDRSLLSQELDSFLCDVKRDKRFVEVRDFRSLAKKMKETDKDRLFPLVYRLIELALLLPVATASVERVFSGMKYVKNDLRNKMGDEWLNDSLVVFVERGVFATIENESILNRFQSLETRRCQLSRSKESM